MVVSTAVTEAMELLARASSTSEVLTLNLTNLLILIVLKALIFGFGLFSFGGTGRSSEQSLFNDSDLEGGSCFLMYTAGVDAKLDCIKKVACEDRSTAYSYKTAAKMAHGMSKYLGMDLTQRHISVIDALNEAIKHSENGGDCTVYNY